MMILFMSLMAAIVLAGALAGMEAPEDDQS